MGKTDKFIFWTPRILAILFLLFLAMFSLDVLQPGLSFWEIAVGLFMHNIPALILLAVLAVSWKYEIVGGIAFVLAGLLYIGQMVKNSFAAGFEFYMLSYSLIIAGPALFIGILFFVGWNRKRKSG